MTASNDKQRIANLEAALEECVAMMLALPYNPAVWALASKAGKVLESQPFYQPHWGEASISQDGRTKLNCYLSPDASRVEINLVGVPNDRDMGLLKVLLGFGVSFNIQPDAEKTLAFIQEFQSQKRGNAPEETMQNVGGSSFIPRY